MRPLDQYHGDDDTHAMIAAPAVHATTPPAIATLRELDGVRYGNKTRIERYRQTVSLATGAVAQPQERFLQHAEASLGDLHVVNREVVPARARFHHGNASSRLVLDVRP